MDITILIWAFAALAVLFVGVVIARKGFEKIDVWRKENQFKFALITAAIVAVVVAVWAGQNEALIECWPVHKFQCFFQKNR